MHIRFIGFKSIRQLNASVEDNWPDFTQAFEQLPRLELATLNMLIGENGAGKSTVIDMIRALVTPEILPTLARDNPEYGCIPEFCIELEDRRAFLYRFVTSPLDGNFQRIICKMGARMPGGHFEKVEQCLMNRFIPNTGPRRIPRVGRVRVNYLDCARSLENFDAKALEHLNQFPELLTGLIDWKRHAGRRDVPLDGHAITVRDDGVVSTWLDHMAHAEERQLRMPNNVNASAFPSGWKVCAAILHWLTSAEPGSVCLLEEPEVHMHPRLQRKMFEWTLAIAERKRLQLVVSTHSAVLINAASNRNIKIIQAQGVKVVDADITGVLERLGYQASDLLQANCVIWVEGPSDRLYLKAWLHAKDASLKEGTHYAIMFYGGRLFSHLSAEQAPEEDLISLRRLNRNSAIVFDSDRARATAPLTTTKQRLLAEFSCKDGRSLAWVTAGREIENYLDEAAVRASLKALYRHMVRPLGRGRWANLLTYEVDSSASRAKDPDPRRSGNKVDVASHYLRHNAVRLDVLDLQQRLDELCSFIRRNNT
ncbi:ATP-dependent nuclease [Pseudomonas sp. UFMG81]|uniref:ATP-dependent nuclease n=1 Tax=Pseudomonas sp. UFMG81 TaxID=2745936 RepID=UPI00188ED254|nr:ATP-binding protein [Pseudomonas sp. UFMG81]